jgi:hypothetical protein
MSNRTAFATGCRLAAAAGITLGALLPATLNAAENGNGFLFYEIARGLDPSVPHLVEIEPVFDDTKAQELKLESICVAGGQASVASGL